MATAVDAVGAFPALPYGLLSAPRIAFCRNAMPMHLASDYIHPYQDAGGGRARCRVRIYLPDDMRDAPVVVCSELPNNPGGSITDSAEAIAAGVIRANELPTPLVWIEHWPVESTGEGGDVRAGRLLQLRDRRKGALPRGDAGADRRRDLEATGPHHRGSPGGRRSVGQAIRSLGRRNCWRQSVHVRGANAYEPSLAAV